MSLIRDAIEKYRYMYYFTKRGKLVLFHGSDWCVKQPNVAVSYKHSECGPGFYAFLCYGGAYNHRNRRMNGTINVYYFDIELLEREQDIISSRTSFYLKSIGITGYYKDMLFSITDGSRYVNSYGGQFFTVNQYVCNKYMQYIIGCTPAIIRVLFDVDEVNHLFAKTTADVTVEYILDKLSSYELYEFGVSRGIELVSDAYSGIYLLSESPAFQEFKLESARLLQNLASAWSKSPWFD